METSSRLEELAAKTPASRDRTVDFLRAASIVTVVFGHWFIGIIYWNNGLIYTRSAIGVTSYMWLFTWVLQVMPIFFFVGGFSNMTSLESSRRKGESTWTFVRSRLARLTKPSAVFLAIWIAIQVFLHLADIGNPAGFRLFGHTKFLRGMLPPGATVPFGPLWFLGVYLVVVVICPATVWLHKRFRWWVPATMIAGAFAADILGFTVNNSYRWFNVAFVLLLPHQLGHFLADGTFDRLPKQFFWGMIAVGLAGLVILTNAPLFKLFGDVRFDWFPGIGYYPKSLLGTDLEQVSNAYPPTVCFMLGGIWSIGAVMLLRPRLSRWLERRGPWKFTIFVNAIVMTLFLWHMTAYLLAILLLWPLGFGHEHDSTTRWWLERPLWFIVPGLILAVLVRIFARFERPGRGSFVAASPPVVASTAS